MTSQLLPHTPSPGVGSCFVIGNLTLDTEQGEDFDSGSESQILLFSGVEFQVGRNAEICSHVLDSPVVSSQHFRIYSVIYERGETSQFQPLLYCEDLQSLNGTWVNNALIGSYDMPRSGHLLSHGDKISIRPSWSFTFHQEGMVPEIKLNSMQVQEMKIFEDRYKITDRLLGQGSHGTVYVARDEITKSQLACKIVNLQPVVGKALVMQRNLGLRYVSLRDEQMRERERLMHEIDILRKLNHPNVISLQKAFRSAHSLYMFTELAPGGDLFSIAASHGQGLEDIHARIITRQIAIAIEYLHSKGIVHRDLKPENILVMNTAIGHRVVLTDFGSSACVTDKRRRMMSIVGTEAYAAPEVYANEEPYTKAIDMWSLGVVAFCLLTGSTLFPLEETQRPNLRQCDVDIRIAEAKDSRFRNENPQPITNHAEDFIKSLLVIDAKHRLTSDRAAAHSWFQLPAWESKEIEMLYDRAVLERWSPRTGVGNDIVEDLPDVSTQMNGRKRAENVKGILMGGMRKIPDCTTSAYFGLSNRLIDSNVARATAKVSQKRTLANLCESRSQFLEHSTVSDRRQRSRLCATNIVEVDGRNMFESTPIEIVAAEAAKVEFNSFEQSTLVGFEVDGESQPCSESVILCAGRDSGSIKLPHENQQKEDSCRFESTVQESNRCLALPNAPCREAIRKTSKGTSNSELLSFNSQSPGKKTRKDEPRSPLDTTSLVHGGDNRLTRLPPVTMEEIAGRDEDAKQVPVLVSEKAYAQRLAEVSVNRAKLRKSSTGAGFLTD